MEKICCIIGHREIEENIKVKDKIKEELIYLIENRQVSTFLFGSKSRFSDFCYDIISELKGIYKYLKRIYVRAEYIKLNSEYKNKLNNYYEENFYFNQELKASKLNYIKRNEILVEKSDICLFYYNPIYVPRSNTTSGTSIAYSYAKKRKKEIINIFDLI